MTENLLNNTNQNDPIQIDPSKNYLVELVGEGKKFKTAEDLARGKQESDMYISHLTKQQDELRADYLRLREESTTRARLEDLIDQLSNNRTQQTSSSEHTPNANVVLNKPVDPNEIKSLVSAQIHEYDLAKKQTENYNLVRSKLVERFGNNYENVLKEQIDNLGLTADDVTTLAKKSPTAFFKTFGLDVPVNRENFQAPPQSQNRSESFKPSNTKRTWTYYEDLRVKDPKGYWNPKTQVQLHRDMSEQGDAFMDAID